MVGESVSDMGEWITQLAARRTEFTDMLAERQSLMVPAEDLDCEALGPASL
jgi:hypothetical protein